MKIAIIGSGPLGLEAAIHFENLGAAVTLFMDQIPGGLIYKLKENFSDVVVHSDFDKVSTKRGREISGAALEGEVTLGQYSEEYLEKLLHDPTLNLVIKKAKVERVHKRFLSLDETIQDKSRMHDLFRVIYSVDPKENILEQAQANPEAFKQLGEDVLKSLEKSVEAFEDFDIVIDATGVFHSPYPMGASASFALNEKNLKEENPIYYGAKGLLKLNEVKQNSKSLVLIGSGETAAAWLVGLESWLEDDSHSLSLVTTETTIFEKLSKNESGKGIFKKALRVVERNREKLKGKIIQFEKDLHHWRDLEPHIKAKTPQPVEPRSQINFLTGYNVSALDRLLDREGLFVTLEMSPFREDYNPEKEMVTLAADTILVATGHYKDPTLFKGLLTKYDEMRKYPLSEKAETSESGFYIIGATKRAHNDRYSLEDGLKDIDLIEKDILKFFSRA